MKLGIVISTYKRADGKTPFFLKRALNSIYNQKYKNFKIYLIGDRYEDKSEIQTIVSEYPKESMYFINLPKALERDVYTEKWAIWSYGGVNAVNHGIDVALNDDVEYICHLDHDDYWEDTHLLEIINCIDKTNAPWMCTKSKYVMDLIYPKVYCNSDYCDFIPQSRGLIHSSVCMNFKKIPLKYRDLYKTTGKWDEPADADLWTRVADFSLKNNLKTTLINKVTCYHLEEGYERN